MTQSPPPHSAADAKPFYSHTWDRGGERCTVCGDKDWMGGSCTKPTITQPTPPRYASDRAAIEAASEEFMSHAWISLDARQIWSEIVKRHLALVHPPQPEAAPVGELSDAALPCPWCGLLDLTFDLNQSGRSSWDCRVECPECGVSGPVGVGSTPDTARADARAVWNARRPPSLPAMVPT